MSNWIPVEERLPTTSAPRFVTLASGEVCTAYFVVGTKSWHYEQSGGTATSVIAWQNRPAPYIKPRRFAVEKDPMRRYRVVDTNILRLSVGSIKADFIPTREAAQRIADIYEEVYGDT